MIANGRGTNRVLRSGPGRSDNRTCLMACCRPGEVGGTMGRAAQDSGQVETFGSDVIFVLCSYSALGSHTCSQMRIAHCAGDVQSENGCAFDQISSAIGV